MENGSSFENLKWPLPNEVPAAPDIRKDANTSGVVESLLQHVDDLSSRLSVQIRRYSLVEESYQRVEKERDNLLEHQAVMRDQVMVLEEKIQRLNQRKETKEIDTAKFQEQIQILEIQAAEVYGTAQERQQQADKHIAFLNRKLKRYENYRRRIQATVEKWRQHFHELHAQYQTANIDLLQTRALYEDTHKRLKEITERANSQGGTYKQHESALIQRYENELSAAKSQYEIQIAADQSRHAGEVSALKNQFDSDIKAAQDQVQAAIASRDELAKTCHQLEHLREDNVRLENQLIFQKRREEERKLKWNDEAEQLQNSASHYRIENKRLSAQVEEQSQTLKDALIELENLKKNYHTVKEHAENLEVLWKETSQSSEKDQEKVRSLQKLNQQLSEKLNEYRRELRELKTQMQDMASTPTAAQPSASKTPTTTANDPEFSPESMNKIDKLLAEIHAGSSI